MKFDSKVFFLFFLVVFGVVSANAQKVAETTAELAKKSPTSCISNNNILTIANSAAKGNELVFIISRLGNKERNQSLHKNRLGNVRLYLEKALKRSPATIITAQSDSVNGYGRLEIYVNSILVDVLIAKTNKDIPVNCYP